MSLEDIYYILFRRKWVILGVSLLGFIAAAAAYAARKPMYKSVAEIYIGYVADAPIPDTAGGPARPAMDPGATILGTELKIVQSFDVAKQVAEAIGPARILGITSAGTNSGDVDRAATMIQENLVVEVAPMTHIISLTFTHKNPGITQPVLDEVITNYIKKHYEIHQRPEEFDPYLRSRADVRKMRLNTTTATLTKLKSDTGIVDMAEEMKTFTVHEAEIKQENYLATAELDEALARAEQLRNMIPPNRGQAVATNANLAAATNANQAASTDDSQTALTNDSELTVVPPSPAEQAAYNTARQHLADLQTLEAKLEMTYTTNQIQVKTNLLDIEAAEARVRALEKATPGLVVVAAKAAAPKTAAVESRATSAPGTPAAGLDLVAAYNDELQNIAGISARISRQTNELAHIKDRGSNLIQLEVTIHELERSMAADEKELEQFEKATEEAAMREELGPDKVSSIIESEHPIPPSLAVGKRAKVAAGIAGGGVALGLGLAFLLEMVLNRSFKRPQEVASRLGLPFFLSVPYLKNGNGKVRLSLQGREVKLLPVSAEAPAGGGAEAARQDPALSGGGLEGGAVALAHEAPSARLDDLSVWRPFHETLRDRLIAYFEMANMTHKPKLVALTSCHRGAGVSTISAGLASLLSETGEGNVLLVNMSSEDGETHRFYKGEMSLGLDDLFEKEAANREHALVQEKLYVVRESSTQDSLPAILPKRFSHLVSKMKASDYDYIIFDMPPVTQISVTPRLARFMDMVLLVVESEKTDRGVAQRAASLLSESRVHMAVVMNKNRSYVPRLLHQEF